MSRPSASVHTLGSRPHAVDADAAAGAHGATMTLENTHAARADIDGPTRPTVYVDTRALRLAGAAGPDSVRIAPDAESALGHLRGAGLEVVLVGRADAVSRAEEPRAGWARLPELPELPMDPQGWMIVGDTAACAQARPYRHLRTILVGPAAPARGLASRACDVEARDLTDAALTILASEAMEPARGVAPPAAPEPDGTAAHDTAKPAPAP